MADGDKIRPQFSYLIYTLQKKKTISKHLGQPFTPRCCDTLPNLKRTHSSRWIFVAQTIRSVDKSRCNRMPEVSKKDMAESGRRCVILETAPLLPGGQQPMQ